MLGVFPRRKARLDERRNGIGTHRKMEGARVARVVSAAFACFSCRPIASASSRVNARLPLNSRRVAEGLLLSPVTISEKPRFAWRFRPITGEIFFARNGWPRAGHAGSVARKFAGRQSPVPKGQVIDFIGYVALQKFVVL